MAANFAGVPLAFAFIATLGTLGIVTKFLSDHFGIDLYQHGFSLFTFTGVSVVYLYFQLPLMILVIAPALDGLQARVARGVGEPRCGAPGSSGATSAIPVLMPSFLGAMILLFGNAFAAYATAYSLTDGAVTSSRC